MTFVGNDPRDNRRPFRPWIGDVYKERLRRNAGRRLLVLGDTADAKEGDIPWTDEEIIQKLVNREFSGSGHTKFVQAALNKHHTQRDFNLPAFYQECIFYNYLWTFTPFERRGPIPTHVRSREVHHQKLREVLKQYRPTHMIVWKQDNWNSLRKGDFVFTVPNALGYFQLNGNKIWASWIVHPSRLTKEKERSLQLLLQQPVMA